jgi:hypothetical protein
VFAFRPFLFSTPTDFTEKIHTLRNFLQSTIRNINVHTTQPPIALYQNEIETAEFA